MSKQHLYLVDGSGYIFRAYHRLPPLTDPAGTPVGAVYGFTAMLWKLITELANAEAPTHLAVIFDAGSHTFRNDMYAQYKAHRPPPPEDLVPQFPLIRDAVRAFSVPCIEQEGVEADDIIASYALAALKADYNVTIVSSDKDLMQLIQPGLDCLDTMKNQRIDRAEVIEKFGVPPEQVGEVLALMGDTADNVPGVRGVGPKTAAELIVAYGSVEGVIANIDAIKKPKLRETLAASIADARLSRELVRLKDDIPLAEPLDTLTLRHPPHEPLAKFLAKHGFRALLSKLGREVEAAHAAPVKPTDVAEKPFVHADYETITSLDRLDWWIAEATRRGAVAVDTETTGVDQCRADLLGISLGLAPGLACYIPLGHRSGEGLLMEKVPQLAEADVIARLNTLFADPGVLKIAQNLKYDMIVLRRHGVPVLAPFDDTMILSYALDAGRWNHGLDDLSTRHLGHTPIAFKDVTGGAKGKWDFAQVDLRKATDYAAEDADVTIRLHARFRDRLWREQVTTIYENVDRPLIPVVAAMEMTGIRVDRAALVGLSAAYEAEIARLEGEIHTLAGHAFSIGSPKQLGEVLFERLGHKSGKKSSKTGAWATDVTELERLSADGVEIAGKVLEWRQNSKLKSTYTDALQAQINPATDRVHTNYALAATSTGRLSSNDPNLQNIPIRTELGRRIRHAFVAAPGHVLMAADYNQIELRLVAHIADVPELKAVYSEGGDVHALTAQEVFGEVTRDTRARAKTINFSIIYGISAFGLAQRLGIDRGEAARYIDLYFSRFPGIRNYMAETIAAAKEQGFVTTLFGRKAHVPLIFSKNMGERQFAERAAVNARVQGTAADIIKRAMVQMPGALSAAGLESTRMLLQVHDELVLEVPEGDVDAVTDVVRAVMANAHRPLIELSVPLGVEIGSGTSWGDAH
ncbi:DNA polymerase I [Polymorphobacter fuscus]|uniref:DNA polymerase I n=1 Tax=Sandarakinorhabdus fusca TaxID=1439888 RepID=A0A7C9GYL3_9SPHN|nr:DNA polymerase I [Polymorphobacter fuscus]KAB7645586.1 DNA polymerase I [Polymorphobacter fuscus]MQT18034.1 DNA polymerase I [Polymorphobacter fuscus]NJC08667.1 DNA polymerase-1 [Polymorphobacter fuscus]